jgi:hypothetical protein
VLAIVQAVAVYVNKGIAFLAITAFHIRSQGITTRLVRLVKIQIRIPGDAERDLTGKRAKAEPEQDQAELW